MLAPTKKHQYLGASNLLCQEPISTNCDFARQKDLQELLEICTEAAHPAIQSWFLHSVKYMDLVFLGTRKRSKAYALTIFHRTPPLINHGDKSPDHFCDMYLLGDQRLVFATSSLHVNASG